MAEQQKQTEAFAASVNAAVASSDPKACCEVLDRILAADVSQWTQRDSLQHLAASLTKLTPAWRTYFEEAARRVEGLFFGSAEPSVLTQPETHA